MSSSQSSSSTPRIPGMRGGGGGGGGGGRYAAMGAKAKDFKGTMRQLIAYLKPNRVTIISAWFLAVLSTIFSVLGPRVTGVVTDELVAGLARQYAGTGSINFDRIAHILFLLLGLYGFSALCQWLQGFIMSGVSLRVTYALRTNIIAKIHRLPFTYFDSITYGEILSRLTNDVDTVNQTLNMSLTQIITSACTVIGILCIMMSVSWILTLLTILFLSLSVIFITIIVKQSQKYFRTQQRSLGNVNGHIEEMFSSHIIVKAFSRENDSIEAFDAHNKNLYQSAWRSNFLSGLLMPITSFVGNITYVAICIFGGILAVRGMITIGGIQAFLQYVRSINRPLTGLANISNTLQQTAAAAERVFEFLAEGEEIPDTVPAHPAPSSSSEVAFNHVRFSYNPAKPVIRDFSACIENGQKIAIVGPTGAGKTTLVKLLMRFYDVNDGSITIDGTDIRQFTRQDLRSLFGMVLQDTWLFSGTIADNIRYNKLDAEDAQVEEAAVAAQVDHFARTVSGGYSMVLNEESDNISAGQKQLLTIARVILRNPGILILDEATSSVDTRTERLIQKAMDNLMQGRTSFIIAHRLSTIRNADLILVIKDGDIVEQGTHKDLLARRGFYAELYESQFAGQAI